MIDNDNTASTHERRITWSLMAVVVAFVLLMTCMVLWITSTLIRNELGDNDAAGVAATATPAWRTVDASPLPETRSPASAATVPAAEIDPTWTPAKTFTPLPGPNHYVRFMSYKVNKSKIKLGECVQVTWDTRYAVRLEFYRDDELLLEEAPIAYTLQDCPEYTGYVVYRLLAFNQAGESNWIQTQVRVDKPKAP